MNDSSVRDISISRVLFFVAAGFLCCWIPMWALALWMRFSPETCPRVVQLIDVFLSYLSASVNPLIYTFTNSEFRREFRKLLRCRNERAWNASNKAISAGDKGDGLLDRRNKRRSVVSFPAVWNIILFAKVWVDFFIGVVVVTLSIYSVPSALDVHFSILTFYVCSITLFCFFLFSKFILRKWLLAFGKTYSCLACSSLFFPCFPEMSTIFLLCDYV